MKKFHVTLQLLAQLEVEVVDVAGSDYAVNVEERLEYQPFAEDSAAIDQRLGKVCDSGSFNGHFQTLLVEE